MTNTVTQLTLLVFVIIFFNSCNIRDEVYRGWALGVGGKPKTGNTIHKEANSSAMSSVGHRSCHSQPGGMRQLSAAV